MENKTQKKRREIVNVVADGRLLSISDMANYFNVMEYLIESDLAFLQIEKDVLPQKSNSVLLASLEEKKNLFIENWLNEGKDPQEMLETLGMYELPRKERSFVCEEERRIFHGESISDIANELGMSRCRLGKQLRAMGVDYTAVEKEGKAFRRAENVSQLKMLLAEGVNTKIAAELVSIWDYEAIQLRKEVAEKNRYNKGKKPLSYKTSDRREQIYNAYSSGMTQQEIADKMGLSRTTVATDLKLYYKEHPEAKDKTILWRQRNLNEPTREIRRTRKDDVLLLKELGLSLEKIRSITQVPMGSIERYLDEEGMLGYHIGGRQQLVMELAEQGYSVKIIAEELGHPQSVIEKDLSLINEKKESYGIIKTLDSVNKRRAEELKLSWQGVPTTEIMSIVGKSRFTVLKDQHITSNALRNNPDMLDYVASKNGDVTEDLEMAR